MFKISRKVKNIIYDFKAFAFSTYSARHPHKQQSQDCLVNTTQDSDCLAYYVTEEILVDSSH